MAEDGVSPAHCGGQAGTPAPIERLLTRGGDREKALFLEPGEELFKTFAAFQIAEYKWAIFALNLRVAIHDIKVRTDKGR